MRRKRAHRMRVLEMPEDDLHVRIPVPIGKTVYRVHPNPACHYGVRAAERAVFGRVITPRYASGVKEGKNNVQVQSQQPQ